MKFRKTLKTAWLVGLLIGGPLFFNVCANDTRLQDIASEAEWQLEKKHKYFKIFSRKKAGSGFLQMKAEVNFLTDAEHVLAQFGDGSRCWAWQARCDSSKIIKVLNQQEKLVYTTLTMPWPLSDRDFIFHSQLLFDPASAITTLTLTPASDIKIESKYVRAESNILYTVAPIDPTSSRLTILMHTDLGGDISPSFVNGKLADELYDDIETLINLVTKANND